MNRTNVSNPALQYLQDAWPNLTPQLRKAARYIMDNPHNVGVSTVRAVARAASVKPSSFVRLAHVLGYDSYKDFRTPFREALSYSHDHFPDRARWLQHSRKSGKLGVLYADMVQAALANLEETFTGIDATQLHEAALAIWQSRNVYVLGCGVNNANARNFAYLASTGMVQFYAIPNQGSVPQDDIAWADKRDILLSMTMKPYRKEVVETTKLAKAQGLGIISISDSPASPISRLADHEFHVAIDTPQFFPSSVSTMALLETLLSFVIAVSSEAIVARVEEFHKRRHDSGIYCEDLA
ncbi:MAG: MurR/RpiR family transcriptional regulator [Pseudomonadota bacterium]